GAGGGVAGSGGAATGIFGTFRITTEAARASAAASRRMCCDSMIARIHPAMKAVTKRQATRSKISSPLRWKPPPDHPGLRAGGRSAVFIAAQGLSTHMPSREIAAWDSDNCTFPARGEGDRMPCVGSSGRSVEDENVLLAQLVGDLLVHRRQLLSASDDEV